VHLEVVRISYTDFASGISTCAVEYHLNHRIRIPEAIMSETAFCYHCGTYHLIGEMRQILTKNGKRWRCIKSIDATKVGIAERDEFGRQISAIRSAEAKAQRRRTPNPKQKPTGKETP